MRKLIVLLYFSLLYACAKEEKTNLLDEELLATIEKVISENGGQSLILPKETDLTNIPQDPKNPLTPEKVSLGKLLFHETGIALAPTKNFQEGTFSCASCHFSSAGFQAGRFQGIGDGGIGFGKNGEGRIKDALYHGDELDVQPIRSPSTMNTAYQKNMLWNGQFGATGKNVGTEQAWTPETPKAINSLGFEGLETQAIAGLGVHRMVMDSTFIHTTAYKEFFDAAFPEVSTEERYTIKNAGLAIAAYERILLSNQAPFQEWLRGDSKALNEQEKKGALLFFGKAKCGNCHNTPALSSMEFYALGMSDLIDCPEPTFKTSLENPQNLGRGGFTGKTEDHYLFKVPQLYNLKDSPFYGHGASFRTIRQVVEYINQAIPENERMDKNQLAPDFKPLNLTAIEITQITAFLEHGLYDNNLKRYEPTQLPSGNCFPNNDRMSQRQLGCN